MLVLMFIVNSSLVDVSASFQTLSLKLIIKTYCLPCLSSVFTMEQSVTRMLLFICVLVLYNRVNADIEHGLIQYLVKVSYRQCVRACNDNQHCLSVIYTRNIAVCKLYNYYNVVTNNIPGSTIYQKPSHLSNITCTYGQCDDTHQPEHCGSPQQKHGASIFGNIPTIMSKIKYQCTNIAISAIAECLNTGQWSSTPPCLCSEQRDDIPHVDGWTLTRTNTTSPTAVPTCKAGYTLIADKPSVCNETTGSWSNMKFICCHKCIESSWVKIFSLPSSRTVGSIIRFWISGNDKTAYCQYIFSPGLPTNIQVKLIKNEIEQAWLIFNGSGTTHTSWFNVDKLISSSWSSLAHNTDDLLIDMQANDRLPTMRFFVGQGNSDVLPPIGYLALTWFNLQTPHKQMLGKVFIVYSKRDSMVLLDNIAQTDDVDFADKMEIWVTL